MAVKNIRQMVLKEPILLPISINRLISMIGMSIKTVTNKKNKIATNVETLV